MDKILKKEFIDKVESYLSELRSHIIKHGIHEKGVKVKHEYWHGAYYDADGTLKKAGIGTFEKDNIRSFLPYKILIPFFEEIYKNKDLGDLPFSRFLVDHFKNANMPTICVEKFIKYSDERFGEDKLMNRELWDFHRASTIKLPEELYYNPADDPTDTKKNITNLEHLTEKCHKHLNSLQNEPTPPEPEQEQQS